jgi:DNA-binding NarL/FixJ family response regulator
MLAGEAGRLIGDDRAAYRFNQRLVARARDTGMLSLLAKELPGLALSQLWAGQWASASAGLNEGLELARQIGQHQVVAHLLSELALIAALRGDEEDCRTLAAESYELATARGLRTVAEVAHWALALLELGLGRAEEALSQAREITTTAAVCWSGLDRIEIAIRAGEPETACAWLDSFEPWAESSAAAWAHAVVLHSRALLADDETEAERLFGAALDAHADAARPFEHARTELALGEFLRRARRRVEARQYLRAALDGFEALRATPWAERARAELRASGETARKRDPSTLGDLTAQELQIAHFVAEGLTNREVAAQLFLSPRTIDFHLRNVFRKLDITSRMQLARLDLDFAGADSAAMERPATPPVRA